MATTIAIFSDVICPWCLIGKRRLERALDETGLRGETEIRWLPFELNPDMPEDGMPRAAYRAAKFGAARSAQLDAEMTERGAQEGITFRFDRIVRTPNTRKAHRLIGLAGRDGRGPQVKAALLTAYFEEGRDVGDEAVLREIGASEGLHPDAIEAAFTDATLGAEIVALQQKARTIGVQGVPFFIVDDAWAVSGAQPADTWVATLRERVLAPAG